MAELKERTYQRGIALQALYEHDLSNHDISAILENRFEAIDISDESKAFITKLALGVLENQDELDRMIEKYAVDWPIDQIAAIDRNIIRIAAYEFAISGETPDKVAINESIELAKTFGSETAPKFVNGVLDKVRHLVENMPAKEDDDAETADAEERKEDGK